MQNVFPPETLQTRAQAQLKNQENPTRNHFCGIEEAIKTSCRLLINFASGRSLVF